MNKVKFVLFSAGVSLALIFTFGCSSDDGGSGGNGSLSSDSNGGDNHSNNSSGKISSSGGNFGKNSSSSFVNGGGNSNGNNSSSSLGQSSSAVLKECDAIFNPDNKFCYDGVVYDKCRGEEYSPEVYICDFGILYPAKCGNESYNPLTQDCCNRTIFSRTTQRCINGRVEAKCEDIWYDQEARFCYDGTVYYKCRVQTSDGRYGDVSYNPLTQFCYNGVKIVETKCGNIWYDQETEFCLDNKIYAKCDGIVYPPATHICQNGVAIPVKCGNEGYNQLTQYCSNGTVKNYGSIIDARDGKKYNTTIIGSQTWMAENLNYAAESSKCYEDDTTYCDKYGKLYNWETAMKVCPNGWHLPSNADWNVLMKFVNPSCSDNNSCAGAGTKLKASSGWDYGTDDFGFSALPGGFRTYNGGFAGVDYIGNWWSSSEYGSDYAYAWIMNHYEDVHYDYGSKHLLLLSVRCVKD